MHSLKPSSNSVHASNLGLDSLHLLRVCRVGKLQEYLITGLWLHVTVVSVPVSSDPSSKVHVLLLNSHSLGVNGAQVGVLKQSDEVCLSGFLDGVEGG